MFKIVQHRTASPRYTGKAVYVFLGKKCVFSGISQPGSTINFVEDLISNICKQENINPKNFEFYDLMTFLGYPGRDPGEFKFTRVTFKLKDGCPVDPEWDYIECPEEVIHIFRSHIGGEGKPYWMHDHRNKPGSERRVRAEHYGKIANLLLFTAAEKELEDFPIKVFSPREAQQNGFVLTGPYSSTPHCLRSMIKLMSSAGGETYIIVDNHLEGGQQSAFARFAIWSKPK